MPRHRDTGTFQDILLGAYYDLISLILVNIIWFLLTVPVITAIPALGGLYYATNRLAHQSAADWRTFLEGFRTHFWLSWRWGLLNLASLSIIGSSLWFYSQVDTVWAGWMHTLMIGVLLWWTLIQLLTYPFLLEQSDRRLRVAIRNSLVMLLRRPLFTVFTGISIGVLILVSIYLVLPAWTFVTGSLCTYLANRAVISTINSMQDQRSTGRNVR
ncbi:MAG: hypothetical protein KatS3mg051_0415 [Anaerolineae bacterium]|nr:MAG: hypothetical protein KatS3mg051_0415 [Anaerolineae bacterium]